MKKTLSNLKKMFLKRGSKQTYKISSVHNLPYPFSSPFHCEQPQRTKHDRTDMKKIERCCLKEML